MSATPNGTAGTATPDEKASGHARESTAPTLAGGDEHHLKTGNQLHGAKPDDSSHSSLDNAMVEKGDVNAENRPTAASNANGTAATTTNNDTLAKSTTQTTTGGTGVGRSGTHLSRISSVTNALPGALKLTLIAVSLCLSMFLVALDMTIIGTAIPEITNEFNSLDDVGWYGSAFFLTVAAFQSTWGKAYRYFPLKPAFIVSAAIFEVGSLICAVAPNSVALIVGRAIAGLGAAGIASGVYVIMALAVEPSKRAVFTGILGATYGIASVIGPLLGGVFTSKATWRWCFYINLPIGGLACLIILFTFHPPETAKPEKITWFETILQMDFPGTFTILCAVICFLLAVQKGGVILPWNSSEVIGLFVGFGLLVILFIVIQYFSGERALLQGRLLKQRPIAVACLFVFFFVGGFFVMIYYLPIYFQSVQGVSASESGVRNLPLVIGASIFSILSGGFISATGRIVPVLLFGSILATVASGLIYTFSLTTPSSMWIGYQALAGFAYGAAIQTAVITGQAVVDMQDIPVVTAMVLFFQTIGGAFFVQAAQSAFQNQLFQHLPTDAPGVDPELVLSTGASDILTVFQGPQLAGVLTSYLRGLQTAFIIAIALGGVSVLISPFMPWRQMKPKM